MLAEMKPLTKMPIQVALIVLHGAVMWRARRKMKVQ